MKEFFKNCLGDLVIVAKLLVVVAIPTSLLLFHVWNQYRITDLGYQIAEVTSEHRSLLEENKKLTVEARLQGRSERVTQLAQERFGLREARPEQVITISAERILDGESHAHLDDKQASEDRPVIQ